MAQMKEQSITSEVSNDEITNLSDWEFKVLVIKILTDLIQLGQKMKKQMKDIQSEIKQNVQETNSDRKETRTQSNDLEQKEKMNIHAEENEETRIWKSEGTLRRLWDNLKCSNIRIIGVPEGENNSKKLKTYLNK